MKFSEAWLRTMVDPPLDTAALCDGLTMAGFEVESVERAAPPFEHVVVGRIEALAPHPNADRLRVASVDVGAPERLQIVCGAPNAAVGMRTPVALAGATLPGGMAIKPATMRGVESRGMLCSAKELGLSDDASGLMPLADALAPGTSLRDALALDDALITLKVLPNRPDCLSVAGIAREVAAITGAPLKLPAHERIVERHARLQPIRIEDLDACPRFAARVIEGIDPAAPTPDWMRQRIERSGIRSISAVVDITNYVMLELGQPLHAYDERHVDGAIVVRFAREGETLTLLNGDVLDLSADLLMVADEHKPLGLAGIMGGEHSGIANDTRNVLLEGAFWNPAVIQGKMRRLGFTSDAGYRFERGVDPELGPIAVDRATALILSICGGRAGPLADVKGPLPARPDVVVRSARAQRLLGIAVAPATIDDVLTRLSLPHRRAGDDFVVTPPSYRFDLVLEEDLVEEIARIHGFEHIPARPAAHVQHMLPAAERVRPLALLKRRLVARDWQEVVTFGFVSGETERALDPQAHPVKVLNPIAAHLDVMRSTLLPGLAEVLRLNVSRRLPRVRIFEAGRIFRSGAIDAQPMRIGGLAFGAVAPEQWADRTRWVDFFDVKGDVEALAAPLRVTTSRAERAWLHPGRSAAVAVEGREAGWIGELHPRLVRHFDLPGPAVVFEVDLAALTDVPLPQAQPPSRQLVVRRDLAVVVDEAIPAATLAAALDQAKVPYVDAVRPFDVYRGAGLPPGKKSLAILVLIRDTERTLTDAEIEGTVGALRRVLEERFGAELRQ
ncbi:MAG TPA: phenylalanine--tRNA ligase subunit beta [Casimicrobiaceae bacterium]|nr:phenylalanine--tRNA ligase subunit beta [Casimicrobiaceae bacterium]